MDGEGGWVDGRFRRRRQAALPGRSAGKAAARAPRRGGRRAALTACSSRWRTRRTGGPSQGWVHLRKDGSPCRWLLLTSREHEAGSLPSAAPLRASLSPPAVQAAWRRAHQTSAARKAAATRRGGYESQLPQCTRPGMHASWKPVSITVRLGTRAAAGGARRRAVPDSVPRRRPAVEVTVGQSARPLHFRTLLSSQIARYLQDAGRLQHSHPWPPGQPPGAVPRHG